MQTLGAEKNEKGENLSGVLRSQVEKPVHYGPENVQKTL